MESIVNPSMPGRINLHIVIVILIIIVIVIVIIIVIVITIVSIVINIIVIDIIIMTRSSKMRIPEAHCVRPAGCNCALQS